MKGEKDKDKGKGKRKEREAAAAAALPRRNPRRRQSATAVSRVGTLLPRRDSLRLESRAASLLTRVDVFAGVAVDVCAFFALEFGRLGFFRQRRSFVFANVEQ